MKKLSLVALAGVMALLLSSCFSVTGFSVLSGALKRKQTTQAQFIVRPYSQQKTVLSNMYQFVLIGVDKPADIAVGKAVWGANKAFGGPLRMNPSAPIPGAIMADCGSNGINYNTITGMTWKAYITPHSIPDKQLVGKSAVVQVALKAKATAAHHDNVTVVGIFGAYLDNGDGIINPADSFVCGGIGTSAVYIK